MDIAKAFRLGLMLHEMNLKTDNFESSNASSNMSSDAPPTCDFLPGLEVVGLAGLPSITDSGFHGLLQLPTLRILTVAHCNGIHEVTQLP